MDLWKCLQRDQLLPLLLSLLLLVQCTTSDLRAQSLTKRCKVLETVQLDHVCSGRYPMEARIKYHDSLIAPNEEYAIFNFHDEPNRYFFAFKSSDLLQCKTIKVLAPNRFDCTMDNTEKRIVELGFCAMTCLDFHFQLADDLMFQCLGALSERSAFVVLHYSSIEPDDIPLCARRPMVALRLPIYALSFATTISSYYWMRLL